jgi:acyl-CoA synthetase (NDP forming)
MKDDLTGSAIAAIFSPRSVAVIGASSNPTKLGGRPVAFLKDYGFKGEIYPVNAGQAEVQGLVSYKDVRDIPGPVDQAVIVVPSQHVEEALRGCAEKGVKVAQVLSSGFAEADEAGRARQERLMEIVRETGIRITGPNALGSVSPPDRFCATFSTAFQGMHPPAGNVAVVTQSGAFGSCTYVMIARRGLGLSRIVATGNEADVATAEVISYLADDPETRVICAAVESCRDGDGLRAALRKAAAAGKPVIFMKVGASELGAKAAATHTGALAGNDKVFDTVIREGGAWRARSIEEMVDLAYVFAVGPAPQGPRAAIVSLSGGIGVMMADSAEGSGLELPPQSDDLRARVHDILDFAEGSNPLDVTAQVAVRQQTLPVIYDTLLASGEYDAIMLYLANSGMSPTAFAPHLGYVLEVRAKHPRQGDRRHNSRPSRGAEGAGGGRRPRLRGSPPGWSVPSARPDLSPGCARRPWGSRRTRGLRRVPIFRSR